MTLNIQQIYDYAKLATLAYVDLSASSSPKDPDTIIQIAKEAGAPGGTARIPEKLGTQMLNPNSEVPTDITGQWSVLDPYFIGYQNPNGHSDPASGFAAMLVQNQTTGNKALKGSASH